MPPDSSQQFLRDLDKKLWSAADRLRASLDAAVYKHAALGLIGARLRSGHGLGRVLRPERAFIEEHGGKLGNLSVYGQDKSARRKCRFGLPQGARRANTRRRARESNPTTWRLAAMNMA